MIILLISKDVLLKWNQHNKREYIEKGYEFTKYGDYFTVKIEDLSKGSHANIEYKCDFCGKIITADYHNYTSRSNTEIDACSDCKGQKNAIITLKRRQDNLYSKALEKCSELGYKLLSEKESITRNTSRIEYECPEHGVFDMRIANLLSGKKCPQCAIDNAHNKFKLDVEEVVQRVEECGGKILNPEEYYNQDKKNLKIVCPNCGKVFLTSLKHYQQHGGQVCEECRKHRESIGEKKIRYYLEKHNISFNQGHWFPDCKDKNVLPFDFYLPDTNEIIEFDGRQHFGSTTFFRHSQEMTPIHDEIKNKYCEDNGIGLLRIPYWKINKIDEILDNHFDSHKDIV